MKYIIYDKATLKVVHILDKEPINISSSLAVARTEMIPQGDMFTVSNLREETEKYTVKEPKTVEIFKEELGETVEDTIFEDVEKERKYFVCDLIENIADEEKIKKRNEILLKINELKSKLSAYDYIGTKIATGRATKEEYAYQISEMITWANEINILELQLGD